MKGLVMFTDEEKIDLEYLLNEKLMELAVDISTTSSWRFMQREQSYIRILEKVRKM